MRHTIACFGRHSGGIGAGPGTRSGIQTAVCGLQIKGRLPHRGLDDALVVANEGLTWDWATRARCRLSRMDPLSHHDVTAAIPHRCQAGISERQGEVIRARPDVLVPLLAGFLVLNQPLRVVRNVVGELLDHRHPPRQHQASIAKGGRAADVFLPTKLVTKLKRFWTWKRRRGESLAADAPLFCNQSRTRISKRRVQFLWRTWQQRAGFDRLYPLHALRHSSVTNVYRKTKDLFLAQRFARHASPLTTTVYTHPSDEELKNRLRGLNC